MEKKKTNMNEVKSATENIRITDLQLMKIKLGLSSLTNTVIVSPMIATLYAQSSTDLETWSYLKRGVPGVVMIFDSDKELVAAQLVIADPDSGFAIWRDSLTVNSNYKATQRNFHTFKIANQDSTMGGIRFPTDESASIFLQNVLCNIPKPSNKPQSPKKNRRMSAKRLKKDEISSPCMFTHVTKGSINSRIREKARTVSGKRKKSKYSGSGSSLDAPDADPNQSTNMRRAMTIGSVTRPR